MDNKECETIECPVCKSWTTKHVEKRESNDILGPGFASWVVDEYWYCKNCGVMFKNVKKN